MDDAINQSVGFFLESLATDYFSGKNQFSTLKGTQNKTQHEPTVYFLYMIEMESIQLQAIYIYIYIYESIVLHISEETMESRIRFEFVGPHIL